MNYRQPHVSRLSTIKEIFDIGHVGDIGNDILASKIFQKISPILESETSQIK